MFHHHTAKAPPPRRLWYTPYEGVMLWRALVNAFPEALAICVMPNHIHLLLPHDDPGRKLMRLMSGWTRWMQHRGRTGPIWDPRPPPERVADEKHARRTVRYIHLN